MDVKGFTIDSESTRDIDDSIWVESDSRGWVVTICIANVAAAVAKESSFDVTARRRAETLYFAKGRTRPMLPRHLSEGSCSLFEGEKRNVMAIRIRLDHLLEPQGLPKIDESRLTSCKKFAYADIPDVLNDESHPLNKEVRLAARLAMALVDKRRSEGAFVLYDINNGWVMSESGSIRQLKDVKETVGHIIVQELMILANRQLARFCLEKDISAPFRNHTAKTVAPPRAEMMNLLEQGLKGEVRYFSTAKKSFMSVMNKASYGHTLKGHYGLNVPAYLHGTSPIRRYADLILQRQIFGYLNGRNIPYTADEVEEICSEINDAVSKNSTKTDLESIDLNLKAGAALSNGHFRNLDSKEFRRVLEMATGGGFSQPVADEFLRRLDAGASQVAEVYQVLLRSDMDWKDVRAKTLAHVVENTHLATSVVTIARQDGVFSEPKFDVVKSGEDHHLVHSVSVEFSTPSIKTEPVKAGPVKVAKQRAVVNAIAMHIEEDPPDWPEVTRPPAQEKQRKVKLPTRDSNNPIGELSEYCQSLGIELPKYEAKRAGGPDHNPEFKVSCQVAGLNVMSPPMSPKKAAKKEAANRAIQLILERS